MAEEMKFFTKASHACISYTQISPNTLKMRIGSGSAFYQNFAKKDIYEFMVFLAELYYKMQDFPEPVNMDPDDEDEEPSEPNF